MVWLGYVSVCCIVGGFKGTPLTQRRKRWSFCDSPKSGRGLGPERLQGYPRVLFLHAVRDLSHDRFLSTTAMLQKLELIVTAQQPLPQQRCSPPFQVSITVQIMTPVRPYWQDANQGQPSSFEMGCYRPTKI
jgi:hypothetical protein